MAMRSDIPPGPAYRFRSKVTGDLLMLAPTGNELLAVMGISPAPQGILQPGQMPAALRALETATAGLPATMTADAGADDEGVTLRQRAWPLMQMLQRCHADGQAIVWGT